MVLRLVFLGVVASGAGLAASKAHAAEPPTQAGRPSNGFVVKFTRSDNEGTNGHRYRSVQFFVDKKLDDTNLTVFEVSNGTIGRLTAELIEEEPQRFSYRIRLAYRPPEGPNDIALVLPAQPRAASLKLDQPDRILLLQLRSPHFEKVLTVAPKGIDTDGDRRADVAFITACVEYPRDDRICGSEITFAARRSEGQWLLTPFCADVMGLCPADP